MPPHACGGHGNKYRRCASFHHEASFQALRLGRQPLKPLLGDMQQFATVTSPPAHQHAWQTQFKKPARGYSNCLKQLHPLRGRCAGLAEAPGALTYPAAPTSLAGTARARAPHPRQSRTMSAPPKSLSRRCRAAKHAMPGPLSLRADNRHARFCAARPHWVAIKNWYRIQ